MQTKFGSHSSNKIDLNASTFIFHPNYHVLRFHSSIRPRNYITQQIPITSTITYTYVPSTYVSS